ncbi:MSMEG_1061 family FMN-dependent PPOX-type flavoprotein [Microbaculum marinum]|uniref:MSMEG_1061 family FMN-dependent PPOX-type flavoprotein n=1 Tax=Microbaculum marinum TaxID=1764581 RepID=A0AAW9S3C2_9HYPH
MTDGFDEIITSRERLRQIIAAPSHRVTDKVIDHVDDVCRRFIAASPFVVIATRGPDGLMDLSPKGDPAGFVHVRDDRTLVVPDRLGNRRIDSFENLLVDPAVGLIFMIPGYSYTLRVSGRGRIVLDAALQERLAVKGRVPQLLLAVTVEEAFMHCAKSMARSRIWEPAGWPDLADVPSLSEAMVAHGRLSESTREMQAIIDDDFETKMY